MAFEDKFFPAYVILREHVEATYEPSPGSWVLDSELELSWLEHQDAVLPPEEHLPDTTYPPAYAWYLDSIGYRAGIDPVLRRWAWKDLRLKAVMK